MPRRVILGPKEKTLMDAQSAKYLRGLMSTSQSFSARLLLTDQRLALIKHAKKSFLGKEVLPESIIVNIPISYLLGSRATSGNKLSFQFEDLDEQSKKIIIRVSEAKIWEEEADKAVQKTKLTWEKDDSDIFTKFAKFLEEEWDKTIEYDPISFMFKLTEETVHFDPKGNITGSTPTVEKRILKWYQRFEDLQKEKK